MLIYETKPIKKVVAEVEVLDTLELPKEELLELTKNESGIDSKFYFDYFKNVENACAYKLGKAKVFNEPKELSEFGVKCAPQSFVYV